MIRPWQLLVVLLLSAGCILPITQTCKVMVVFYQALPDIRGLYLLVMNQVRVRNLFPVSLSILLMKGSCQYFKLASGL